MNYAPFNDIGLFLDQISADCPALKRWSPNLRETYDRRLVYNNDGLLMSWKELLGRLPLPSDRASIDCVFHAGGNVVSVTGKPSLDVAGLRTSLLELNPWRVGPYHFFGVDIDSEWRSFKKWDRITRSVYFDGAKVLDVGCNNGYFGFKALAEGARWVMGVEPFLLYNLQFELFRRWRDDPTQIGVMPISAAEIPAGLKVFDVALSMGVLYHRSDPIGHLQTLHGSLRKRGQLVLETMAIDSPDADVIVPPGKFAKMRGVWFMPTIGMLKRWLDRTGFADVMVIDVSVTDENEQRRTDFMPFESLRDFLDPADPNRTVEGHPRPVRVALSAVRAN